MHCPVPSFSVCKPNILRSSIIIQIFRAQWFSFYCSHLHMPPPMQEKQLQKNSWSSGMDPNVKLPQGESRHLESPGGASCPGLWDVQGSARSGEAPTLPYGSGRQKEEWRNRRKGKDPLYPHPGGWGSWGIWGAQGATGGSWEQQMGLKVQVW